MYNFEVTERYIYVLFLAEGKYYIGQTDNLEKRIKKHGSKKGASWTSIYKPIELIETQSIGECDFKEALLLENQVTLSYMENYGWLNVRGGNYASPNDLYIYSLLKNISDLNFEVIQPENVPEKHNLVIRAGMNRSKNKLDILTHLEPKIRTSVKASISGFFNNITATSSIEEMINLDANQLALAWYDKHNRGRISQKDLEDVTYQISKLLLEKIIRKSK